MFKIGDEVIVKRDVDNGTWVNVGAGKIIRENDGCNDHKFRVDFGYKGSFNFSGKELRYVTETEDTDTKAGKYQNIGMEIGSLVDTKQSAYGNSVDKTYRLMQIYLEKWRNEDGTYTIPDSLLQHMLLMVRIIDKQNRIFSNPEGDLLDESPYSDLCGYSLLGREMVDNGTNKS